MAIENIIPKQPDSEIQETVKITSIPQEISSMIQLAVLGSWLRLKKISKIGDKAHKDHSYDWSNHADGSGQHGVHHDWS